jgi:pimeloyl-ACP methyl ester carboxylesterase
MVLKMFGDAGLEAVEARLRENLADLRGFHILPDVGHWTQQEKPDACTGVLIDWLATL